MTKKRTRTSGKKPVQGSTNEDRDFAFTRKEIREIRRDGLILTAIVSGVFVVGIFVYASYGGPWVDSLDDRIGEIVASRARGLVQAERKDEAVIEFQKALAVHFDDPIQRVWVSHDLGKLLLELGKYDEAIEVAETSTALKGETGEAFSIWHKALVEQLHEDQALALTDTWFAWGLENDSPSSQAWAKFYQGIHLRTAGNDTESLEAFEEGLKHKADGEVGRLLSEAAAKFKKDQTP